MPQTTSKCMVRPLLSPLSWAIKTDMTTHLGLAYPDYQEVVHCTSNISHLNKLFFLFTSLCWKIFSNPCAETTNSGITLPSMALPSRKGCLCSIAASSLEVFLSLKCYGWEKIITVGKIRVHKSLRLNFKKINPLINSHIHRRNVYWAYLS